MSDQTKVSGYTGMSGQTGVSTRCPKNMLLLSGFEFLTFGGVFLGVKNNPKNFGNQKILSCLAKF